ncbi:hypothetical protein AZI87_06275 [Bdellovibrio bacteriovorus]|uniref:Uncharacterized protein n=1 Tax=Bdellovibrio bacteriovorus TaxID=959 RepID=A0A162GS76_BDEBC|nr:hypothetical protein [Bdellovibrio bacteriovorus]KYG68832.1 hypothetical protein AZI87_06275 [Bdellovibrio bacteriovorus]
MPRFVEVQKGFNSDITVRGQKYHVQTEDWGLQNPFLVSRIFCNGAVMKTIKTPYDSVLRTGSNQSEEAIKLALRRQHSTIIDTLMAGGMP